MPLPRGLGVQQLRASVALVIEWLTICHRQGWLGGQVLNERAETVLSSDEAAAYCDRIIKRRQALGLAGVADADALPEHQKEVTAAYGNSASGLGSQSAYGDDIGAMLAKNATSKGE